jgi:hypothetical protein
MHCSDVFNVFILLAPRHFFDDFSIGQIGGSFDPVAIAAMNQCLYPMFNLLSLSNQQNQF